MLGTLIERKQVAWLSDRQLHADAQALVHKARTTATVAITEDADLVAAVIVRRIEQGIAAHQAIGQVQVDVRTGFEGGEDRITLWAQFDADDAFGLVTQGMHEGHYRD